jgi:hypothetical protein
MIAKSPDEHELREIQGNDYAHPSVRRVLLLKSDDHILFFEDVMKDFKVEMVG